MVYDIFIEVISAWQVIVVGLLIMIILPIIFYFASFDKTPVKIKRVPMKTKGTQPTRKQGSGQQERQSGKEIKRTGDNDMEEEEDEEEAKAERDLPPEKRNPKSRTRETPVSKDKTGSHSGKVKK